MNEKCKQCSVKLGNKEDMVNENKLQKADGTAWLKCPNCGTYNSIGEQFPVCFTAVRRFKAEEEQLKAADKKRSAIERVVAYSESLPW